MLAEAAAGVEQRGDGRLAQEDGAGGRVELALVGGLSMIADPNPTPAGCMRPPETWGTRIAGVLVVAIDPAAFGDAAAHGVLVAGVLDDLGAVPPAPGVERVLVPGEPERLSRERRERDGIPVPAATWADLLAIGERFGVAPPREVG